MEDKDLDRLAVKLLDKMASKKPSVCPLHSDFLEWKEIHAQHHDFIANEIARRKDRVEVALKFKNSFVGAIAVACVGGLGWIGKLILEALQKHHL